MWNNQKQQKLFSFMSSLQTYYYFQLGFLKVNQHAGNGTKRRKDNHLQSLELACRILLGNAYE